MENGAIDLQTVKTERFRLLLRSSGMGGDARELSTAFLERLSEKTYLMPHAISVLKALSKRIAIVLVTNGIAMVQKRRLAASEIGMYFQDVLISADLGVSKPDPAIFHIAVRRLGLPAGEILCIGDSPSSDIRGAANAGIDSCWFNPSGGVYPSGEPEPNYIIRDLRELLDF
jgi:YjjG family noncanonical pyrimidine nucleotidase